MCRTESGGGRVRTHNDRALAGRSPAYEPSAAAGEQFADAERILADLPLVKRGADRDRDIQIALVHATFAVAATLGGSPTRRMRPERKRTARDPQDRERTAAINVERFASIEKGLSGP